MIEERRKTTSQAIDRIKEGEKLCTKAIDAVSMTLEVLLEDDTAEKFVEAAHHAVLKIVTVKVDMKKLSIKEKIAKVSKLKQLQQEVKTLRNKE